MKKIPFDIKYRPEIESGKYVVETREGSPVTILEWDEFIHGMAHMILGRYEGKIEFWNFNGRINRVGSDCNLDLFIRSNTPELTEFEESIRICVTKHLTTHIKDCNGREISSTVFIDNDTAKELATELLELAKKELCKKED